MNTNPTEGVAVDASMRSGIKGGQWGVVEWRGVDIATGEELFRSDKYPLGTIGMAELMAIYDGVHWALSNGYDGPIYSDSVTALVWASKNTFKTTLPKNENSLLLFNLIWSDQGWVESEEIVQEAIRDQMRKWMSKEWGENPADFGYKGYQKKSFYAVLRGREPGIYKTWDDCRAQVNGFKEAKYKGFVLETDALRYMGVIKP